MSHSYYYLHTNGDLIHKPAIVVDSDPEYFVSDFVRKVWTLRPEDRGTGYILLIEAAALGANITRVLELAKKWGMDGDDGLEACKQFRFDCEPFEHEAGTGYRVTHQDDNPKDQVGEGTTPLLAMISYAQQGPITKAKGE